MAVILSTQGVYKEFSGEKLFEPLSFLVRDHDRLAILGPNGSGKSTLIKMIMGSVEKSGGNIILSKNCRIGYLSQDVISDPEHTLYEEAMEVFTPLIEMEKKLHALALEIAEKPEDESLLTSYSNLQAQFETEGGYDYPYRIAMILNMFSFTEKDYSRTISSFSGGEKTRVAFAKLLLINPDLLILDEPTNHLDIISIEWLEDYLKSYQGAVLFVSHDITFVKHLANCILDIDNHVFTYYNTTYDNFALEKKNRYENLVAQFKAQEEEKAKLERFITFYMPKPRFASRAKDRQKKLEKLEASSISDPTRVKARTLNIGLQGKIREGKKLMDFNHVSVGYDSPLISDISFTLYGQDHLAVMGANGIGKSTFGKVLLNELKPYSGDIRRYFHLTTGVLRQDIRSYSSEETLFDYFRDLYPRMSSEEIYAGLGRYAFTCEESNEKKLCCLSGGELMRVEILRLSLEDYDMILLDEPTNHLDMMSISELVDALNSYEGTLVIISHDRDFIDKVCNKLLYFYQGNAYYYEGPYSEFKDRRLTKIISDEKERLRVENQQKREEKRLQYQKEKAEKKTETKKRLTREPPEKIMERIDKSEAKKKELTDACYLEENYSDPEKMKKISGEIASLDETLRRLYAELELAMP